MKKQFTKAFATVLAVLMLLAGLQISVFAADETITVNFSCTDSSVIIPRSELKVKDGLAEEYGYTVATADHNGKAIDDATFFDALVAAHKAYYGEAFTRETAQSYLVMSTSLITKAFGKSAAASGFVVNKVIPNDGILNPSYGSCTGYACDTAVIKSGDELTYYFYQDQTMWGDWASWFDKYEYTATVNEAFDVNIKGYSAMWYGFNDIDTIMASYAANVPGADIFVYNSNGEPQKIGTTDENGNAALSFSEPGTYTLYATALVAGAYGDSPIVLPWCEVTVNPVAPEEPEEPAELQWWEQVWNWICYAFDIVWSFLSGFVKGILG